MSALAHPSPTTAAVTVARGQSGSPKPPGEEPPPGNALPRTPNPPKDPAGGNSHNPLMSSGLDEMESLSNSASLVDYGYRYYDPVTGRWPSRDPIVEHAFLLNQSKNLRISRKVIMRVKFSNYFAFLTNNPLNSSDFLGLSDKIREPKKGCKIEIRCGPVAAAANTMYHCGVVVNGVEYGIGGDAGVPNRPNGKGKADGATVFGEGGGIPGEYANPAEDKAPKGHKTYKGSCECDCTYVELCMKFHQNNTIPRPYSAWSGPNSNTYAHQLLNVCRCQMDTWMDSNFLTWNSPNKTPNWNHPVSNDYPAYPSDDTFD
jgi:RHS repeat-associated protein